jgi:hypothetical protein
MAACPYRSRSGDSYQLDPVLVRDWLVLRVVAMKKAAGFGGGL